MFKKKNLWVIALSCLIIIFVSVSSLLGYIVHLQWRYLDRMSQYCEEKARLDTLSYSRKVKVSDLKIAAGQNGGVFAEGTVLNKGLKTVDSLALRIDLLDADDKPVRSFTVYPLAKYGRARYMLKHLSFKHINIFPIQEVALGPDESVRFNSELYGCPAGESGRARGVVAKLRLHY
ncbi:MAG: hypothetical protein ABH825_03725 [Candidatus Omnitrophota bacterium]